MLWRPACPGVSEEAGLAFAARGVRAMAVRLPQVHGGDGKCGLVNWLLDIAREKGVSGYIGDGGNRWSGAHRLDVARLYRLALEKGLAGTSYHAVADEGVTARDIAEIVGRQLNLPVASIPPDQAAAHFGMMAMFAGMDGAGFQRTDAAMAGMEAQRDRHDRRYQPAGIFPGLISPPRSQASARARRNALLPRVAGQRGGGLEF